MGQIVIIESGATKSDWRVLEKDGRPVKQFHRPGTNVSTMPLAAIEDILAQALRSEGLEQADGLYLYTAGVVTEEISARLKDYIRRISQIREIDVQNDLMGAARGVCGHSKGIVAIMGTGSNTCFFDGTFVNQRVYSGGYVLGDDGSAAALGKLFLSDLIKGLVPESIAADFARGFDASYAGIVENVYRSGAPSKYLGSLAPFVLGHYAHPYAKDLIERNFQAFIDRSLRHYDTASFPLGIVGGFGWACQDIFRPLCEKAGIRISRFLQAPIDGLCQYHCQ